MIGGGAVAEWVRELAWTGDRVVLPGSNPAAATSLRKSLLAGVYARGSKIPHIGGKCVTCRGFHHSLRRTILK